MPAIYPVIYIVVPCFNEAEILPESARILTETLQSLRQLGLAADKSRLLFVDDGSTDGTWSIIEGLYQSVPEICGLKLRCNRGHQIAVMTGMLLAAKYADAVVTIDADLQDDPAAIKQMVPNMSSIV